MKTVRDTLLDEIDAFRAATGMTTSEFGVQCMGDPSFLFRLRDGKDIRGSTVDKVRRWMADAATPLARKRPSESRSAA